MRHVLRLLPVLAAGIIFGVLAYVSAHPAFLRSAFPIVIGTAVVTSLSLAVTALVRKTKVAPTALPLLLVLSMSCALLFADVHLVRVVIAGVTSVLFLILVRHLAEVIHSHEFVETLAALSEWSAVMTIFGASAGLLAAITFLTFAPFRAIGVFTVLAFFVSLTLGRLSGRPLLVYAASGAFLSEAFILAVALPLSHWVSAALLAIVSYLLFLVSRGVPHGKIKRLLIATAFMTVAILATARWR